MGTSSITFNQYRSYFSHIARAAEKDSQACRSIRSSHPNTISTATRVYNKDIGLDEVCRSEKLTVQQLLHAVKTSIVKKPPIQKVYSEYERRGLLLKRSFPCKVGRNTLEFLWRLLDVSWLHLQLIWGVEIQKVPISSRLQHQTNN